MPRRTPTTDPSHVVANVRGREAPSFPGSSFSPSFTTSVLDKGLAGYNMWGQRGGSTPGKQRVSDHGIGFSGRVRAGLGTVSFVLLVAQAELHGFFPGVVTLHSRLHSIFALRFWALRCEAATAR